MIRVILNLNQVIQMNQRKDMKNMVVKHHYLQFLQPLVAMVLVMKMRIQSKKMKRHILIRVMIQYMSINIHIEIVLLYQIQLDSNPMQTSQ